LLLVLTLALAACGSGVEGSGVPGSSVEGSVTAEGSGTAERSESVPEPSDDSTLKPPPILLLYKDEQQRAVQGSYCVDYVDEASGQGSGTCADMAGPIYPKAVTSVAPGDRVTFVLAEAAFGAESTVTIRPLGCTDRKAGTIVLEPGSGEHAWIVGLEHGAYQLDVFARFTATDGRSGDVSGTFGLTVAGAKENDALGVQELKPAMKICEFTD
jgi:hypothetical protein